MLDIEGTTTPIDFVMKVMFPYARAKLDSWSIDAGDMSLIEQEMAAERDFNGTPIDFLHLLMDLDRKSTALKSVQGKIWETGFTSGELVGEVYEDVVPALHRWRARNAKIFIYSSGSVLAQKQLFGHLQGGSILHLIDGHYDTHIGPKKAPASYRAISKESGFEPTEWTFLSDSRDEIIAAREAGVTALLVDRGDTPAPGSISTFNDLP